MLGNIYVKIDLFKPDKEKSTGRIDVAVTLTMVLKRAIRNENHERFFDGRGIIKLLIL